MHHTPLAAVALLMGAALAHAADVPAIAGAWTLDPSRSEDAHQKMRAEMEKHHGGMHAGRGAPDRCVEDVR